MPEHKKGGHCIGLDRLARMFALRPSRAPQALKQKRTFGNGRIDHKAGLFAVSLYFIISPIQWNIRRLRE